MSSWFVDTYILSFLVLGLLLLLITLGSSWINRLPLSYALIYLAVGILLGPGGINLVKLRPEAEFLERATEFVVLISLYSCGLKMNRPLKLWAWSSTARLIGFLMPISIGAIALLGHWFLKLNWGEAILLGAILAPTDPVLASEVQLSDRDDRNELRFGLTSEGGLNDALAFPFVYFGLHWIEDGNWESWFKNWVAVDLLWAIAAGLVMGIVVAKAVAWVDQKIQNYRKVDELFEDFTAISTILLTYALTEMVNGYGFLAVFVAGVVAQRSYRNPEKPRSQLSFIERLEKLAEVGVILLLGSLLRIEPILRFIDEALLVAGALIFVVRPIGAWISTIGEKYTSLVPKGSRRNFRERFRPTTRWLLGWFGIRGVGSLYYLAYAYGKGLEGETGEMIGWITYLTVVISVILHGISSTPLMKWHDESISDILEAEETTSPSSSQ
ncbi:MULTISPECIES: sodium:proton antiporter [Trichocoleus]|uniref:Sodium:proton antiporter n=1 Tax=Trichocoleus desertorum GB2-A4 TaxID=2933944 RepID=A0ABV0J4S1_9CYAN|nr:sodium:proton antiporter [Trichocoleus sp. FACHB-46]MBD1863613.1 sodium:proton antiporter [Trichocoleus sp. FACHB-46]